MVLAWVLTRYRFPGRRLMDAAVDLPFALPTAVAGIALASLYGPNGWLGAPLMRLGIKVAYTPLGILVALIFVGLPFVVRSVQPLVADLDREIEEASATLGATRPQTLSKVVLPALAPAILTGFALTFARAVGEYGSVIFIAGNVPYVSEIVPLLIVQRLEEYDYAGATGVAVAMLAVSFAVLLRHQSRSRPSGAGDSAMADAASRPRPRGPPSAPPRGKAAPARAALIARRRRLPAALRRRAARRRSSSKPSARGSRPTSRRWPSPTPRPPCA